MKYSKDNPLVREAIYYAFNGLCFYTGRPVPRDKMHVDHLYPISKGGEDSIYNYVLTFRKPNIYKSNRIQYDLLERIQYLIKTAYAPRVLKKINELKKIKSNKHIDSENLQFICNRDLFWAGDKGIRILSSHDSLSLTEASEISDSLVAFLDESCLNETSVYDDAFLTTEMLKKYKSIYFEIGSHLFKVIGRSKYYNSSSKSFKRWTSLHFAKAIFKFWHVLQNDHHDLFENMNSVTKGKYKNKFEGICHKYPPPEKYWDRLLKFY